MTNMNNISKHFAAQVPHLDVPEWMLSGTANRMLTEAMSYDKLINPKIADSILALQAAQLDTESLSKLRSTIEAMSPALKLQEQVATAAAKWTKLPNIPSAFDTFAVPKLINPGQAALAETMASIEALKFDRGAANFVEKFTKNFHDSVRDALAPALKNLGLWLDLLPANLRALNDLTPRDLTRTVEQDSIPLAYVPRAFVADLIIKAKNNNERRAVLIRFKEDICNDCQSVLSEIEDDDYSDEVAQLSEGVEAVKAGLYRAAQSAFTVAIDWLVYREINELGVTQHITSHAMKKGEPSPENRMGQESLEQMNPKDALVWAPIRNVHFKFNRSEDSTIKSTYSRHTSVHTVDSVQYTEINAVHSMMLATSLLAHLVETRELHAQLEDAA